MSEKFHYPVLASLRSINRSIPLGLNVYLGNYRGEFLGEFAFNGLFLSLLLFLSDKGSDPAGWVYKSEAEMGKETGLTKREQQTARRKLLSLDVIAIMRGGWKNTYHFKVIWDRLYQVITYMKSTDSKFLLC
jgi:hypothetical protein